MSDIRRDRLYDQYVLIASERIRRPDTQKIEKIADNLENCPFCKGHESFTPSEIYAIRENSQDKSDWSIRVVPNLYKALQVERDGYSTLDGMFETIPGVGAHEIVIDTPDHHARFSTMGSQQIALWLQTIAYRIRDLRNDTRLIYASVFKNSGAGAGATQVHPHTQILVLPIMPDYALRMMDKNLQYYRRHGRGRVEDLVKNEIQANKRIVLQKSHFTAYCPFASSFPFEVLIAPHRNVKTLDQLNRDEITELSEMLRNVFTRLDKQLGDFDYNLSIDMTPLNSNFENEPYFQYLSKHSRLTVRIMPRIYRLGGFEVSTKIFINPIEPEEAARLLRQVEF